MPAARRRPAQRRESRPLLYLDSSALVKRYLAEEGSAEVRAAVLSEERLATSVVAYAELRSAFLRAERDRRLDTEAHAIAVAQLDAHWDTFTRVTVDAARALAAGRLVQAHAGHALRGFDAIHLACAHRIAAGEPASVAFACWDLRLWRAARDDGLVVIPKREPSG